MKRIHPLRRALLAILLASLTGPPLLGDNVEFNPVGPRFPAASVVSYDQFLGARFEITSPSIISSALGEFYEASGSFFVALVPLASHTALPFGDPSNGVPFNPGEVAAHATFELDRHEGDYVVETNFSAGPGIYGIVFGTGLYETMGYGGMTSYHATQGSSKFFWSNEPWRWQESSSDFPNRIGISVAEVPESAHTALIFSATFLLLTYYLRRKRAKTIHTNVQ